MEKDLSSRIGNVAEAYFSPKQFEKDGRIYKLLGVRKFKRYMPTSGDLVINHLRKSSGKGLINGSTTKDLHRYERYTRLFEATHLGFGVPLTGLVIDAVLQNRLDAAAIITTMNIAGNIYPVMVQRYNRARLYRTIERNEKRRKRRKKQSTVKNVPLITGS